MAGLLLELRGGLGLVGGPALGLRLLARGDVVGRTHLGVGDGLLGFGLGLGLALAGGSIGLGRPLRLGLLDLGAQAPPLGLGLVSLGLGLRLGLALPGLRRLTGGILLGFGLGLLETALTGEVVVAERLAGDFLRFSC